MPTKWTDEQQAFIDACKSTVAPIMLRAVAGAGKTTVLVAGVNVMVEAQPFADVTCVAFNKQIADELGRRMATNVTCKTLNAIGHGAWARHLGLRSNGLNVQSFKTHNIARELWGKDFKFSDGLEDLPRLVSVGKAAGLTPGDGFGDEWEELMDHYALMFPEEIRGRAKARANQILERSIELANEGTIDFDDQLYMPVTFGGSWFENDRVLIDEAQDVSRIQAKMLRNILREGGQLFSVGDPNQAIYGFRGAGSDSMEALKKLFHQTQMNLTYTFRCSKAVTDAAREIVPDIKCPDWAVAGSVTYRHDFNIDEIKHDGAVLCRNMRPLVDMAFRLLSRGIKCYIAGRDIAQNLLTLIDAQHAEDIPDLELKLSEYLGAVTQRMTALGRPDRAESYADRINVINACIASLEESTIPALKETIRSLFYNDSKGVRLGTIHGAKGLEWDTVYFLDSDLIPSRYATLPWQLEQEMNLRYVALTRAHIDLVHIYSQGLY